VKKNSASNSGIQMLIEHYRRVFRVPENLNHYSREDFMNAERFFIKIALRDGNL